ncbi:hypothetical protein GMMP15_2170004 [Candidatus Magnetomoraceae bacterium gMMP-15]
MESKDVIKRNKNKQIIVRDTRNFLYIIYDIITLLNAQKITNHRNVVPPSVPINMPGFKKVKSHESERA